MNRDRNIQLTGDMAKKRAFAFIAFHQMHPPKPNNRENQTRKPSPTAEIEQSMEAKQTELKRRQQHYAEIREQLQCERARILERLLPARFSLAGEAQVLPVAVEIRLANQDEAA